MCYVVTPNYKIGTGYADNIAVSMSDTLHPDDIPENINIFLTSKNNQYGIVFGQWLEGNVFDGTMPYKKRQSMLLRLKEAKYNYLPLTSNCKEKTVYDCVVNHLASKIIDQQLSGIKICIPAVYQTFFKSAFNNSFELCEEAEENHHMVWKIYGLYLTATKICPKSCIRTEYVGSQNFIQYSYPGLAFFWRFESTNIQVYQEYLIYDEIGMIGSIGGLLGLFLGFSFLNVIFYFIGKILRRERFHLARPVVEII